MKLLLPFALFALSTQLFAANYEIDKSHSEVGFSVKHLVISTVKGSFKDFSGKIEYDPKNLSKAKFEAKIAASSIYTNDEKRDAHLKDEDFFFAKKFPDVTFKSTEVLGSDPKKFQVKGDLTMRGVTKSVVLNVTFNGEIKDPWGNIKAGFTGTTTINRKDVGLVWNKALDAGGVTVGDEVMISLEIESKLITDNKKS